MNTASVIRMENVSVSFGNETILHDINIKISAGEKIVLIGPSGQGKSVLLKTMAGLITPTQGEVFIYEQPWSQITQKQKKQLLTQMGMLFQKNALFDSLTCGENIAFPLREVTTQSEVAIQKLVEEFLEAVGLSHVKNLYPDEISGGMQKRLGIARALALNPKLIFYDDPTAGLDPITSRKIIELINDLQKKYHTTLVAITNDMNRAYQLADFIYMIYEGHLLAAGTPQNIKENKDPRIAKFIRGERMPTQQQTSGTL